MSVKDIKKIEKELEKVPMVESLNYYDNPCLIILDAIMSRSRVYEKTVVPKINYFERNYSDINTLEKLIDIIKKDGVEQFAPKYLDYQFKQLGQVILDVALVFNHNRFSKDDLQSMKLFAESSNFYKDIQKVKGIGIATARYLAILLNIDTVKPDVHIMKLLSNCLGRKINEFEAIELLTIVAGEVSKPVAILDNSIWQYMSNPNNEPIKFKLQSMTYEELLIIKDYVDQLLEKKTNG